MQLTLQIFEDETHNRIRSVNINGDAWFVGKDLCDALGIANASDTLSRLDDDEKQALNLADSRGTKQRTIIISESGMYSVIFQSKKAEAKKFRKWVTSEVLPRIRKAGSYTAPGTSLLHNFVRRFNDNWDRTDQGFFSVISELYIRLYGRFEQVGYVIPDKGEHGREMRPDNSVGRLFSTWLKSKHPELAAKRKTYSHLLPEGFTIEAYQYPNDALPLFIEYVDTVWIPQRAENYFSDKDPKAISFLPKLLPPSV